MKNKLIFGLGWLIFGTSSAVYSEVIFQPRAFTGVMDYEFRIPTPERLFIGSRPVIGGRNGESIKETMPLIGIGGTFILDKNFVDIYYQQTVGGSYDDNDFSRPSPPSPQTLTGIRNGDLDRDDIAIAFGRAISDRLSLSLGYKQGSTEYGQKFNIVDRPGATPRPHQTRNEFELDGPFIGASYGLPIGSGVLGFTLAIADLSGELKTRLIPLGGGGSLISDMSGDATGTTFGVSWKAPINNNWVYALSLDTYSYDFDIKGSGLLDGGPNNASRVNDLTGSVEEDATTFKAAVIYRF